MIGTDCPNKKLNVSDVTPAMWNQQLNAFLYAFSW